MAHKEIFPPLKGVGQLASPSQNTDRLTSEHMSNCRPQDTLEKKLRIGQRPGLDKWGNGTQIGGPVLPVVAMCSVSTTV